MKKRAIDLEIIYPYSRERVWQALTNRRVLAQWLMPSSFEPKVGHRFQFTDTKTRGNSGRGTVHCEVLTVEEPRQLSYTWQRETGEPLTVVTWTLEPVAAGTRLRLQHREIGAAASSLRMFSHLSESRRFQIAKEIVWRRAV